jgi:hypothetical protein
VATISDLIIAASVDPQGVKRGLDQALGYTRNFAASAETVIGQTFSTSASQRAFEARGAEMVEGIIGGMQHEMDARKLQLREQLARGIIDRKTFNAEGAKAAQAFNEALLASISHLEGRKLLSPGMREQLVNALREDGIKAGEALAQGIQQGTTRSAGALTRGLSGSEGTGLKIGGRNAAPAVVASAFAFEGLARSASAAEGSVRAATRSVATFAAGFGPQGAVVAALIAGGIAMTEWWGNRNKEIEEARKKFKTELDGMVNDANASGLIQKLAQLERGERAAGASSAAPGNFKGGLNDLIATQAADREKITAALRKGRMAEVNELVETVRARQVQIDEMKRQQKELTDAILTPPPLPRAAGGMLAPMQIKAEAVKTPMQDLEDRVKRLTTAYDQLHALGKDTAMLTGQQSRLEHEVSEALRAENDQLGDKAVKLRGLLVEMRKMTPDASALANMPLPDLNTMAMNRTRQIATGIGKPVPPDVLQTQVEYVAQLERQARVMQAIGASGAGEVEQRANDARERAIGQLKGLLEASQGLSDVDGERTRVQAMLIDLLDKLNVVQKKTVDNWADIRDGIAGVINIADGLGFISADLRRAAGGALDLADALKKAAAARAAAQASGQSLGVLGALGGVGNALGMVGAGISIISGVVGLFKHSNEEVVRALHENSKRLSDVNATLAGGVTGLGAQASGLNVLNEVDRRIKEMIPKNTLAALSPKVQTALLEQTLKDMGITMDQFKKIIADTGIELFDKNGRLIYSAVAQAQEYLKAVREAASKLTDSLEDQTLIKELHDRVFGKTSDADAIARELAILKQFAPDLAKQFQGLDATTKEGREAIEKALQALVTSIEQGKITPDMLGDFESIKDLIDIILGVQSSLDSMGDAVDTVTASLMNVPSGYKVALARFNATTPDQLVPDPLDIHPWRRRFPGMLPGGSSDNVSSSANITPTYVFEEGSIQIDAREQSPEEIFDSFLKTAKRKAAVRFGNSTMWSQVQE